MVPPVDVLPALVFALEADGVVLGRFRSVAGLGYAVEVVEFRDGGDPPTAPSRKVPGTTRWSDITLERGYDGSSGLYAWLGAVVHGDEASLRRDGAVVLLDDSGVEAARWAFRHGWPSSWQVASGEDGALVERVTITHEGLAIPPA